jgi:HD-GYP domain-containing protein (c-di-GMP phosphodiesterase class II)/signal transduction histidine kinase
MPSKVLVVEPDSSVRELLKSVIEEFDYEVYLQKASGLSKTLSESPEFSAVFWNSSSTLTEEQADLVQHRPKSEIWILMEPTGLDVGELQKDLAPFQRKLGQPFRSVDVMAALNGEPAPPEDATLRFLRAREREFTLFRKKESQLREAHRHQQELERMKNTFLSLVSHELRTPLTIISGNLHVLKKLASKWDNAIATECVGSAFEGTTRLSKLVDELLRFTVSVPQKRDQWDLALTLRRVVGELQPLADNRGLSLNLDVLEKIEVEGDPAGLPDAIHQLIENALVFNQPGGKVEVSARPGSKRKSILIEVLDDGPGIEGHELDKIFHPFYQIADVNTRKVEGLGIGLSLARRTIEAHGGTLKLKSIVGTGTRATVNLPIRSQITIPLATESSLPEAPKKDDIKALKTYAQDLYELLESERVSRRHAEEQKRVLEQTFVETLVSLIRMVDPRVSGGTFQGERVLDYARAVARQLDPTLLSRPEFLYGLLLYDIGKIGVAESVLSKTGVLTDQERQSAQAHAEIGAELLTSVGVLRPAIDAVRSHHERWDGSGYPDGLSGKEIPLLARIIAVVDSFDAMTVDRPYREALSPLKAKEQILNGADRAFDPEVVAAFARAWKEIEEIFSKANASARSNLVIESKLPQ